MQLRRTSECNACELHKLSFNIENIKMGYGKLHGWKACENAKYFFVGLNPSHRRFRDLEYAFGGPSFSEGTGIEFVKILKDIGILEQSYVTNLVKCSTESNSVMNGHMEACLPILKQEIDEVQPEIVIAMGTPAYQFLAKQEIGFPLIKIYHPNYYISYNKNWLGEYMDNIKKVTLER